MRKSPKVPLARGLIVEVLQSGVIDGASRVLLIRALELMTREPPCRRALPRPIRITAAIRREVHRLADTTAMSMHEISEAVGLHNIGRVSEILTGQR